MLCSCIGCHVWHGMLNWKCVGKCCMVQQRWAGAALQHESESESELQQHDVQESTVANHQLTLMSWVACASAVSGFGMDLGRQVLCGELFGGEVKKESATLARGPEPPGRHCKTLQDRCASQLSRKHRWPCQIRDVREWRSMCSRPILLFMMCMTAGRHAASLSCIDACILRCWQLRLPANRRLDGYADASLLHVNEPSLIPELLLHVKRLHLEDELHPQALQCEIKPTPAHRRGKSLMCKLRAAPNRFANRA
eukprot:38337-Chlamydomonas_euryale.AAC.11